MSATSCHNCGADPARGMASMFSYDDEGNEVEWRLCHEGESPTCYEQWTRSMPRLPRSLQDDLDAAEALFNMDLGIKRLADNTAREFGGILRCERCGETKEPEGRYFHVGWPEHCGATMRWWTRRQIMEHEMPPVGLTDQFHPPTRPEDIRAHTHTHRCGGPMTTQSGLGPHAHHCSECGTTPVDDHGFPWDGEAHGGEVGR